MSPNLTIPFRVLAGISLALATAISVGAAYGQASDGVERLHWITDYDEALAEARKTGKPIFLEFRCVPCVNGREFDAKVVYTSPDSSRGKLMSKYVLARINTMTGIDIARYDRDWHNSLYYFVINSDEQIYLRYGGRDGTAADAYLDFDSLELALKAGLDEHKKFLEGNRSDEKEEPPLYPEDFSLLRAEVIDKGRCTECHLIGDYSMQEKDFAGLLDPITDLYRSPDIRKLGLHLDVPRGLSLEKTTGSAADAGLKPGDTIIAFNGESVLTFGDLQYEYDKTPRRQSDTVKITVDRNRKKIEADLELPFEWWKSDLGFRHWTAEPQLFFESEELTNGEKAELNLPVDGFAGRVTGIDIEAVLSDYHSLEVGDIVAAVNQRKIDPMTKDLSAHITIRHSAGKILNLTVLRGEETLQLPLATQQLNFRKTSVAKETSGLWVRWSEPDFVTHGKEKILRYRAAIANGHLLVEARHEPGWHSYAMDNPARSRKASGHADGSHELPTEIEIPGSLKSAGPWKQTEPIDFSKPEIHWHTFGFKDTSYFALPLDSVPKEDFPIRITSQVCDADSCAGTFDLQLSIPAPTHYPDNLFTRRIIDSLHTVAVEE